MCLTYNSNLAIGNIARNAKAANYVIVAIIIFGYLINIQIEKYKSINCSKIMFNIANSYFYLVIN